MRFKIGTMLSLVVAALLIAAPVQAGFPVGADTYQMFASPFTGGDSSGDGGTGAPGDLNYYYVGQTFSTQLQIISGGTTAANMWVDYNSAVASASNLLTGLFFSIWSGQTINPTATGPTGGRVFTTGAEIPVQVVSGVGTMGSVDWTMLQPSASNYGTGSPSVLDINVGQIGDTTESNISLNGADLLDDEEDFTFHVWADTRKPFAANPVPGDGSVGVAVESNFLFELRDTLNGEGDNSGVGTGLLINANPGTLTFNDGGGAQDYTAYDSYACSGPWGTNLCNVTVNPPSPSGIGGDVRNWEYSTTYVVDIADYQDRASANQNQLGDANGPNTMNAKQYSFTTEGDTVAPAVVSEIPSRGSSGSGASTNITVTIEDRKTYPNGVSGVGMGSAGCTIGVSSPSFTLTNYTDASGEVTVTATNYGHRFVINPATDFAQDETVSVSVSGCEDNVGNVMTPDNWTFTTSDAGAPFVDTIIPDNDAAISADGTVTFHLKDTGTGVNLQNVVVYVNGVYYTNDGQPGQVTTNGTRITFAESLNFNGGNYGGDTTSVSGNPNDYLFVLDPEINFSPGEVVPVAVYARDASGNIMERVIYGLSTGAGQCTEGSAFCGDNTSWNGAQCEGTGGDSFDDSGDQDDDGDGIADLSISDGNIIVTQIDQQSVLVSWYSNKIGSSRVVYGTSPISALGGAPNFGYPSSTQEFPDGSVYHSVIVDGLTAGTVYYFRPVTTAGTETAVGAEVRMTPRFATQVFERFIRGDQELVCALPDIVSIPATPDGPLIAPTVTAPPELGELKITDLEFIEGGIGIEGIAIPNSRINLEVF